MKVISFLNLKGGVGKTTSSDNLAVGLVKKGFKVLLVDLDPQANTTAMFIGSKEIKVDMSEVLLQPSLINEAVLNTQYENLDLLPATLKLAIADKKLKESNTITTHDRLVKAFKLMNSSYDYVIIDCPPILNLLTTNVLFTTNEVIIPIKVDQFALQGMKHTVEYINEIIENCDLEIDFKILFTMRNRNNIDKAIIEEVSEKLKGRVFKTTIRTQAKPVTDSTLNQRVVIENKKSAVAQDYELFVEEVLNDVR